MKIDQKNFPVLGCFEKNRLTRSILKMLNNSGFNDKGISNIQPSLDFFFGKELQINYISSTIHQKISDINNFKKAKSLLTDSPETVGLLLLPETILPDFSKVPSYVKAVPKDYPINAILYSWLSDKSHYGIVNNKSIVDLQKRISEGEKPPVGENWERQIQELLEEVEETEATKRNLVIIPIDTNRITQATYQYHLISCDDIYGWPYSEKEGNNWYGKIHDYVMSFILFYNYTESVTHVIHGIDSGQSRRLTINDEKFINESQNNIEIIDLTYFTKLIRTGEFGVQGHFRVQHYGEGNSQAKISFIESYKKNGYTRGAKIENKL